MNKVIARFKLYSLCINREEDRQVDDVMGIKRC